MSAESMMRGIRDAVLATVTPGRPSRGAQHSAQPCLHRSMTIRQWAASCSRLRQRGWCWRRASVCLSGATWTGRPDSCK